jgi:hypothetical protein
MTRTDYETLQTHQLNTVSQLLAINELTGDLDRSENVEVFQALHQTPLLQLKLRELIKTLRNLPVRGKQPILQTTASIVFHQEKTLSSINKKRNRMALDLTITTAPAYHTRRRDGVYVPDIATFNDAYKVLRITSLPSKTKEVAFETLNRTIWTNNKAFKSRMTDSPNCDRCGQTETMEHLLLSCPHYSEQVWAETSHMITDTLTALSETHVARIELTPKEIIFNKPHPAILLYMTAAADRMLIIMLVQEIKRDIHFRRMNLPSQPNLPVHRTRIQAHIISVIKKLMSQYEYQGASPETSPMPLLTMLQTKLTDRIE